MNLQRLRSIAVAMLLFMLIIATSSLYAETFIDWSFVVSPHPSLTSFCGTGGSTFYWRVDYDLPGPVANPGPTNGTFQYFNVELNGNVIYTNNVAQPFTGVGAVGGIWNVGPIALPYDLVLTWIYAYNGVSYYKAVISYTCVAPGTITNLTFTNLRLVGGSKTEEVIVPVETPPDDRLNWKRGDLHAVIYRRPDANGDPSLQIYTVDAESKGQLLCVFTLADLSDESPAEHRLIRECSSIVHLYQLSSGEAQVNIGPDAEGKNYVLVFDADTFEVANVYTLNVSGQP
jgi:hypothetical protein